MRQFALPLCLACVLALLGVLLGAVRHAAPPNDPGLLWPKQPELQPFALDDARGGTLDLESLRGHWSLVFIGFTQCPDWCPTTLTILAKTSAALADEAAWKARGQVLFVSVDAERDTPEQLARYVGHFDAGFRAATAAPDRLHLLTTQLDMRYTRLSEGDGSQWWYDHSSHIALIGPNLHIVALFDPPHAAPALAARLRALLRYFEDPARPYRP
jgi:protein SCO1/2